MWITSPSTGFYLKGNTVIRKEGLGDGWIGTVASVVGGSEVSEQHFTADHRIKYCRQCIINCRENSLNQMKLLTID